MTIEVKVPVLPESVSDATIASWHKKPGDAVKRDENLVDLETDKVVLEVPAPADGVLKEIKQDTGATVTSQQVLAIQLDHLAPVPGTDSEEGPTAREQGDFARELTRATDHNEGLSGTPGTHNLQFA